MISFMNVSDKLVIFRYSENVSEHSFKRQFFSPQCPIKHFDMRRIN